MLNKGRRTINCIHTALYLPRKDIKEGRIPRKDIKEGRTDRKEGRKEGRTGRKEERSTSLILLPRKEGSVPPGTAHVLIYHQVRV
jgi:hypothetical protein